MISRYFLSRIREGVIEILVFKDIMGIVLGMK